MSRLTTSPKSSSETSSEASPRSSSPSIPASSRRTRLLLVGLLAVLGLLYLALLPTLRRMNAETERITRQAAINQAEEARLRELRSALDLARTRVAQQPADASAQLELAQRIEATGDVQDALQHAEIGLRLQPRDLNALLQTASLRQRLKHFDTAMDAYLAALTVAPQDSRALSGLAYLYVQFGWTLKAEQLLLPVIKQHPEDPHLKVALALAYMQHADSTHSEQLLREVQSAYPNQADLWTPLVDVYMKEKRYPEAIDVAQHALQQTPDNKALQLLVGEAYYHMHDLSHARQTLEKVLAADPDNITAHFDLALCANSADSAAGQTAGQTGQTGRTQEAIQQLEWIRQHDPAYTPALRVLGQLYLRAHREEEGRQLTAAADRADEAGQQRARLNYRVADHPENAEAHRQIAQVYQQENDLPRAIVEWKQVLALQPNDSQARAALRQALLGAGRLQEANSSL